MPIKIDNIRELQSVWDVGDLRYLKLDQTTPQTVSNGKPIFSGGIDTATITSSSGAISFDNENLLTTGTLGAGAITGTSLTASGLTATRIVYAGTGGLLSGNSAFIINTATSPVSMDITGNIGGGGAAYNNVRITMRGTMSGAATMYGLYSELILQPNAAGEARFVHIGGQVKPNSQTIANSYGLYIDNITKSGAGTVTNSYGLYVKNPTLGGTINQAILTDGDINALSFTIGANTLSSFVNLDSLADLSFASTSFVKMTGIGTFALDTATYLTAEADTLQTVMTRGATTATQLTSTLAIGTSPFAVTSTTVNTNLNADLWDGFQFSDYLDQAVKQASSPTFATPTVTGITIGANTLTTSEWAFLDGQDQGVKTTSSPTFAAGTFNGALTMGDPTVACIYSMRGAASTNRDINFYSGTSAAANLRWSLRTNAAAESGSNAGSDFDFISWSDAGASIATNLRITRSSGAWAIASPTATDAAFTSVTISARQNITATASKNFVGPSITLNTAITGGFSNTGAIQGYFFNNLRGLVSSGSDSGTLTTQIGVNGNVGNLNTDTKINPLTTSSIGYEATMNIRRGTITNSYGFFQAANVTLSAPSAWVTGTAYANNALVKPTVANGFYYVSSGGTSGGSEPVWPATSTAGQVPATVVDNDITWTEILIPAITNEYGVYITPTTSHNYFGGTVGIGSLTLNSSRFRIAGSISRSAWGNTGCQINVDASTTTDTSSSGTVASAVANGMGVPTFAASSATTFTDAATLRIGGGPSQGTSVTITNAWALWVDSDNIRADNGIALGTAGAGATGSAPLYPGVGQMTITTSAANTGGLITLGTTDTSITANDVIGTLDFYANDTSTSTNKNPARIQVIATNTIATDINPGQMDFYTTPTGVAAALTLGMSILNNQAVNIEKEIRVRGDIGGLASANTFTNVSDITANSTGVGTIKFKGTTSRDSSGFIKIYIGTTAYYIPVFSAITG